MMELIQGIVRVLDDGIHGLSEVEAWGGAYDQTNIDSLVLALGRGRLIAGDIMRILAEYPKIYIVKDNGKWAMFGECYDRTGKIVAKFDTRGL